MKFHTRLPVALLKDEWFSSCATALPSEKDLHRAWKNFTHARLLHWLKTSGQFRAPPLYPHRNTHTCHGSNVPYTLTCGTTGRWLICFLLHGFTLRDRTPPYILDMRLYGPHRKFGRGVNRALLQSIQERLCLHIIYIMDYVHSLVLNIKNE